MKNKHILDIVTTPYLIPKGSSLRVNSVVKKLAKDNKVDLLTYPIGEDPNIENVCIFRVGKKNGISVGVSEISLKKIVLDIKILIKAFSLMLNNKYDVVHCEDFEAAFIGFLLSFFFPKKKYVYDLHNTIVDNLRITNKPKLFITLFKLLTSLVYPRFDLIIANWKLYESIGNKEKFLLYDESDITSQKVTIPTDNKYLAYSGNFKTYQGVENFVKVYAQVNPSYDLVLIGNKTDEIVNIVKELDMESKIHFTGVLDIQESNYILKNALFCLIPRISGDQPGLKMIHHVMLDKLSLASDIPANTELLKNGYNSVLYKDNEELEDILKDIDSGKIKEQNFKKGLTETQKDIEKIWSYDYFINNYSKIFNHER